MIKATLKAVLVLALMPKTSFSARDSEIAGTRLIVIAAVMLRRQQADAIISAREKIVEGAVSMVHMALERLGSEHIVELDEERKAAMVTNLLVVLCADEAAQPVVNAGTLHH